MATFFPSEMGRITGLLRLIDTRKKLTQDVRKAARDLAERAGEGSARLGRLQELASEVADAGTSEERRKARERLLAEFFTAGDAAEAAEVETPQLLAAPPAAREGADEAEETVDLEEFFEGVSSSIVATQKALDRRSLDYVRNLHPQVAPAHFAIPSVKAEMKVGFRKVGGSGVNLVLFTSRKQKEDYGESTVSFEVAAAPPPPGPAPGALPGFVAQGADRERALDTVAALVPAPFADSRDRAVVLRHLGTGGEERYIVVWPARARDPAARPELKVFALSGDDGGAARAVEVDEALYDLVLVVEAWLAALRPPEPGGG